MARKQTWGTPGRTTHYLQPRPAYSRAARAFGLGAAVAVVLLAFHLGGWKEPLMPGGLSRPHATIETCQQCHLPRTGVSNLRCQRCHDPSGAGRLVQVAHVSQIASAGRRNVRAVDLAED